MKKIFISVLSIFMAVVLLSGCTKEKEPVADINGIELDKFVIVYSDAVDYDLRAAEYIKEQIKAITGIELEIKEDDSEKSANEIVVGDTARAISQQLTAPEKTTSFNMLFSDGSVAMEGEKFVIAAAAYYFVKTYVTAPVFSAEIASEVKEYEPIKETAKNFILLIGDGMGEYQSKLFEYMTIPSGKDYSDGESVFYGYMLPYMGKAKTNSLSGLTDSAASGTALSTGYKTTNGRIGRDKDGKDLKLLTELALEKKMGAAVMSTETQTGATPSAFSAHANNRDEANAITISQAMAVPRGLTISCNFNKYDDAGIKLIEEKLMTVLNDKVQNENGFFMMYEEAYIDKHCHSNDMETAFLAVVRFNQVIGRVMEFAFYNPATFVLVTADHETGGLEPDENNELKYNSTNHTRADVPVFAYGVGAEGFDGVTVNNVQIPKTIAKLMGESNFGDPDLEPAL